MKKNILTVIVVVLAVVLLLELAFLGYHKFGGGEKLSVDETQGKQTEGNAESDTAKENDATEGKKDDLWADSTETSEIIPETDGSGMPMIPVDPQTGRPSQSGGENTATQPTQSAPTQQTKPEDTEPAETGDSTEPSDELEENELPRVPGSF